MDYHGTSRQCLRRRGAGVELEPDDALVAARLERPDETAEVDLTCTRSAAARAVGVVHVADERQPRRDASHGSAPMRAAWYAS